MRYFGTKTVEQLDEDAVAAERLTAIAGRFKTAPTQDVEDSPTEEGRQPEDQPD